MSVFGNSTNVRILGSNFHDLNSGLQMGSGNSGPQPGGTLVDSSWFHNNAGTAISATTVTATISNNVVENNSQGIVASGSVLISGNTVSGHNSFPSIAGIFASSGAQVIGNTVFNNAIGIQVSSGASAIGNRVFANTVSGIFVPSSSSISGAVSGNLVYGNPIGIDVAWNIALVNNTIYDNTQRGVRITPNGTTISLTNNTIIQEVGTAVEILSAVSAPLGLDFRNNIFQLGRSSGGAVIGLDVADSAQAAFTSDYNLFDLGPGGKIARWQNVLFGSLLDWSLELGFDAASFSGDPGFVAPAGPDLIRGFVGGVDHGADDNFRVAANSITVDHGDPRSPFFNEPGPNGARVNIGSTGNTSSAATSAATEAQILGPGGIDRLRVGQATTISFRTAGLAAADPALFIDVGASNPLIGTESWNTWIKDSYRTGGFITSSSTVTGGTAPAAVYQTGVINNSGAGVAMSFAIPVSDGSYGIRLHFTSGFTFGTFDIALQGSVVQSGLDVNAATGGNGRAYVLPFTATASGGAGIRLDLINRTGQAMISGIEIVKLNPPAAAPTANVEVSLDNGGTWSTIATNVLLDQFGAGAVTWTPDAASNGTTALFRVTATNGAASTLGVSDRPFLIAPAGHSFYVDDGSNANDFYTPNAVGNNANSGVSPDAAMASLSALLRAYDLGPGDTVFVDTGTYTPIRDIILAANDSGTGPGASEQFLITGPTDAAKVALFDRGTTATSADVFRFTGADWVTLSHLSLTNASIGVELVTASASDHITLDYLDISQTKRQGVLINSGNTGLTVSNSYIHGQVNPNDSSVAAGAIDTGNFSGATNISVIENRITGYWYGVNVSQSSNGVLIDNNNIFDIADRAISIYSSTNITISNNVITNNGIGVTSGDAAINLLAVSNYLIIGNTITGHLRSSSTAITLGNSVSGGVIQGNIISGNTAGISGGSGYSTSASSNNLVANNTISNNTTYGIQGAGEYVGNIIFGNASGALLISQSYFHNNLVYGNTTDAVFVKSGGSQIVSNTIRQANGAALRVQGANNFNGTTNIRNNILWAEGGIGIDVDAASEAGFKSDYNLFYLTNNAIVGNWGGHVQNVLSDWQFRLGLDLHGIAADPQFVDPASGNYHLLFGSPAVDAGDPHDPYSFEPSPDGGRINIGFDGNTSAATVSRDSFIQVLGPNGNDKLEVGELTTITWRTAGLATEEPVLLINLGGDAIQGPEPWSYWASDPSRFNNGIATPSPKTKPGLVAPDAIFNDFGQVSHYAYNLADGDYIVRLQLYNFNTGLGGKFDIKLQGQLVADDVDGFAILGTTGAYVLELNTTISGGTGLVLDAIGVGVSNVPIAGIEISRRIPAGTADKKAKVEVSLDNGQNWQTIANNVALDRYGTGSVDWRPDTQTNGNTALVRVTVGDISDTSDKPFLITNSGHFFYIDDGSNAGDEYTPNAVGNDFNSGKSPDSPMATLDALLRAYKLEAGDVVRVDTGQYLALRDLVFDGSDTGSADDAPHRLTIQGPTDPNNHAVFDRANFLGDSAVFRFRGSDFVSINNIDMTGANRGLYLEAGTALVSEGIHITGGSIYSNQTDGVLVSNDHPGFIIDRTRVFGNKTGTTGGIGIEISGSYDAQVLNVEVFNNGSGIISQSVSGLIIDGANVHDNAAVGIRVFDRGNATLPLDIIRNSRVFNNAGGGEGGIRTSGDRVLVTGNIVSGQTTLAGNTDGRRPGDRECRVRQFEGHRGQRQPDAGSGQPHFRKCRRRH